ncbi:glycosyltransferase family 4 protein [Thalassotalea piscium]|uniref:Glycosyltransferase involved in cell wall biosynthesis n=1 Tax=Thalassotalea piscium TaxID=1230533 RepID=A0A7X0NJA5_9GAMM|nr:glycosyltransferase family 4 protein [Thalassotalea piscium]MBB6544433.1 glycosyltransferase involved in cell wall biosynthesis [Thalassotalea piscium]
MNLIISCEFHFYQTPDKQVWTTSSFSYDFWQRYLNCFESVIVIARVKNVAKAQAQWRPSSGKSVSFFNLPEYQGLFGLIKRLPKLILRLKAATKLEGMFLFRVPSQTASILTSLLPRQRTYALEVVGDPEDVFSSGVGGKMLAPILGYFSKRTLKKQCQRAVGVSYVTQHYLQQKYPSAAHAITSHYSSLQLNEKYFSQKPRVYTYPARKLVFIGSLNQLYKAPDILFKAFAKLVKRDCNFHLTVIGTGVHQLMLEQLAQALEIQHNITFTGEVNHQQVLSYLQHAEVFVLPSRTEGLPRAMIEAMAQGLPCVGSVAGGIPELLAPDFCVPINDINALYMALNTLCNNTQLLTAQSTINLAASNDYQEGVLTQRRTDFYQKLKDLNS